MSCAAKFGWNWSSGSGEDENMKSLQTNGQTDRRRTTGDQKSILELSAQVSSKNHCIDDPNLLDIKSLTSMFIGVNFSNCHEIDEWFLLSRNLKSTNHC